MTDRTSNLVVVLEQDMRVDDAETIMSAIRQIRGVVSVTPNVWDYAEHVAQSRVRRELGDKLLAILYPPKS